MNKEFQETAEIVNMLSNMATNKQLGRECCRFADSRIRMVLSSFTMALSRSLSLKRTV